MNILINRSVFQVGVPFTVYTESAGSGWGIASNVTPIIQNNPDDSITITVEEATTDFILSKGGDEKAITIVDDLFANYDGRESIINAPITDMVNNVDACGVGVNSSGDYREFNAIIASVYDNMNYLLDYSNSLGGFPISYENRYGLVDSTTLGWSGYPDDALNNWVYDSTPNDRMMTTNDTNVIMVNKPSTGINSIVIQGQDGINSQTPIAQYGYLGYIVGDVIGISATESTFIVLDETVNNLGEPVTVLLIYVRDGVTYNLATYWGDNPSLPESLVGAIDMAVYNGDIYILLENEIKIFNNIGYLLRTIDTTEIENPTSIGITNASILISDVDKTVLPATSFIVEINSTTLDFTYHDLTGTFENYTSDGFYEGAAIEAIATGGIGTYFYIVTETLIYKLTYDYKVVDKFGEVIADIAYNAGKTSGGGQYQITYLSGSDTASLAISTNYDTHRVTDTILLLSMIEDDLASKLWSLPQCSISGDEYATDWVYNRCFDRLYDNIGHIHRSIIGVPNTTFNLPINNVELGGFRPTQYSALPFDKSEIYVGMNEIHAEPSINRAFRMLYKCMVHILDTLSQSNFTIGGIIITLDDFQLVNFTGFNDPTPVTDVKWEDERDGNQIYFDIGRSIDDLEFTWLDTFGGDRSNPNFTRAFKYRYNPYEFILDTNQYSFTDSPVSPYIDNGIASGGEWGVRVAYNIVSLTDRVKITWNRRIYIGTMAQVDTIDNTSVITSSITTPSEDSKNIILNNGVLDISIPVTSGSDDKYYIAIPSELTSATLHPLLGDGLDGAVYNFTGANAISIPNFINEYTYDAGDYMVYVGNINGGTFNVSEVNYRLVMVD